MPLFNCSFKRLKISMKILIGNKIALTMKILIQLIYDEEAILEIECNILHNYVYLYLGTYCF